MNTTATPAPPKTQVISIEFDKTGAKVEPYTAKYLKGQIVSFVSNKDAWLQFVDNDLFPVNGIQLKASKAVELPTSYPGSATLLVSLEGKYQTTGTLFLARVGVIPDPKVMGDPPKIIPGS